MFDGKIVHDVLYDLGDSELVDLEHVGKGAVGPCCRTCAESEMLRARGTHPLCGARNESDSIFCHSR